MFAFTLITVQAFSSRFSDNPFYEFHTKNKFYLGNVNESITLL